MSRNQRQRRVLHSNVRKTEKQGTDYEESLTCSQLVSRKSFHDPITVNMQCIGAPDRLKVKLRYSQSGSWSGSATPAAQTFNVNSLFDPDRTGVGHQPSFFDLYASYYSNYYVRGAWVKVTFTNTGATTPVYAVAFLSDVQSSSQTVEQMSEAKYAKMTCVGLSTGQGQKTLDFPYVSIPRLMGQPNAEPDDNMYAAVGASPADCAFLIFKATAVDGTTTFPMTWKVDIIYDCIFKDVNQFYSS